MKKSFLLFFVCLLISCSNNTIEPKSIPSLTSSPSNTPLPTLIPTLNIFELAGSYIDKTMQNSMKCVGAVKNLKIQLDLIADNVDIILSNNFKEKTSFVLKEYELNCIGMAEKNPPESASGLFEIYIKVDKEVLSSSILLKSGIETNNENLIDEANKHFQNAMNYIIEATYWVEEYFK